MSSSPSALDALVQEAASLLRALRSQGERLQHVDIANVAAALALHYGFYRKTNGKPNPTAAARAFGKETAHPGAVLNWLERIKQIKKINEEVTDQISSEAAQCEEVISQLLRDKAFTAELSHPLEDEDEAVYRVLSRLGFESPATTSPVSSSPASSQPKSKEFMAIERLIACIGPAGMERIMGTAFIVAMDDKNIYLATCAHVLLDMPEDDERNPAEHGVRIGFGGNPIKWYESRAHVRYLSIPPPSYFKQKADKLASELVRLSSTPDPTVQRVLTAAQTAAARAEAATTPNADLRQIIPEHWLNSNNLIVDNKSGGEDIALLQLARVPDMPQLKTCPFADALLGAHAVFAGYGQSGPVCSAPQPMQAKISNFDASSGFLKIGGSMLPGQSGGPVVMKYTDNRRKRFLVVGICVRSTEKLVCEARPITHVLEAMERLELKAEWVDVFDESSTCSQCAVRSVRKHVPEPSERFGLEAKWVDVLDESSMSSQCADEWVQVLSNPHSAPSSSTLAASVDRTMMRAAQRHAFEAPTNGRADFDADSTGGTSTVGDAVEGQLVRRAETQPVDTFKNVVTRLVADFEHQRQLMEQLLSTAELEKKEARLREEQEKKEARSREAMIDEVNSFVSKAASATRDYERKIQYMQLGLADTLFKKKFCKLLALVKGHCDRYRFTRHAIHWLATPSPRAVHWRVAPSATRHPINRFVVVSDVNRAIVHSALKQLIRKLQTRPWSTLYLVAAQCLSDNMRMFVQHVCAEGVELDALLDQLNTWRSTTQTVDEIGAVIRRAERRVAVDCLLRFLSALNLDARASLRAERQTAVERETQKHAQEDAVFIQAVVSGDVQQAQEAYKTIKERGRPRSPHVVCGILTRRPYAHTHLARYLATTKLQSHARRFVCRRKYLRCRGMIERLQAVVRLRRFHRTVRIQAECRRLVSRRCFCKIRHLAICSERLARGFLARRTYSKACEAVVKLQAAARMRQACAALRRAQESIALIVALYRRRRDSSAYCRLRAAAVRVQASGRRTIVEHAWRHAQKTIYRRAASRYPPHKSLTMEQKREIVQNCLPPVEVQPGAIRVTEMRALRIAILVTMLKYAQVAVGEEAAADVLLNLAMDDENKQAIADAGGIKQLVELWYRGTSQQKEKAAAALGILAVNNDDNQRAIAGAGGIKPLVALITSGSEEQKEQAAAALRNLASNNDDNKRAITWAGGIEPLVALIRSGSEEQKEQAAAALRNLAWNNDANQRAIAGAGGIEPLVALYRSGSEGQKEKAAGALASLAWNNDDNQRAIAGAGRIEALNS